MNKNNKMPAEKYFKAWIKVLFVLMCVIFIVFSCLNLLAGFAFICGVAISFILACAAQAGLDAGKREARRIV